jgi:hypothetical protein
MIKIAGLIIRLYTLITCISPLTHSETIALIGGRAIDVSNFGDSHSDLEDVIVLSDGERISAVGSRDSIIIPEDARIIDIRGKYIVPGLIEGFGIVKNQSYANAYLYMGVTSIIGMSGGRPDILIPADNPLEDIHNLKSIETLIQRGRIINRDGPLTLQSAESRYNPNDSL